MADWSELKRLAEACNPERCADEEDHEKSLNEFYGAVEPEDLVELIEARDAEQHRSDVLEQNCAELAAELERVRAVVDE